MFLAKAPALAHQVAFTAATLVAFIVILYNFAPLISQIRMTQTPPSPVCSSSSMPGASTARFEHMHDLQDLGPRGDDIWNHQILPPGGGLLWARVPNGSRLSVGDDDTEGWGITMFHALHCLQMIREVFKVAERREGECAGGELRRLERGDGAEHAHAGHAHGHHHHDDTRHATHCLSYLYQVRYLPAAPPPPK